MKNSVRILFLLVSAFLVLQLVYIWKFSELYPAIRFPGFGKIPQVGGKVSFTKYEVIAYSSQDSVVINPEELFKNIPKHFIPNLLNGIIKKRTDTSKPYIDISEKKLQDYQEFKTWIVRRLNENYNKNYERLVINKFNVKRAENLSDSTSDRSLIESVSIPLH